MKRVLLSILLVCAFAVGSNAAVVDDAPLPTVAVQTSAAKAIDFALVTPPVGDPASGEMTCHYKAKKNSRSKGCNVCPRKGDRFDSGIQCTPDSCPRSYSNVAASVDTLE